MIKLSSLHYLQLLFDTHVQESCPSINYYFFPMKANPSSFFNVLYIESDDECKQTSSHTINIYIGISSRVKQTIIVLNYYIFQFFLMVFNIRDITYPQGFLVLLERLVHLDLLDHQVHQGHQGHQDHQAPQDFLADQVHLVQLDR